MSNAENPPPIAPEGWPRALNWVLIGIGVLAFGLIIADRLDSVLKVDDTPEIAENQNAESRSMAAPTEQAVAVTQSQAEDVVTAPAETNEEPVPNLHDVFGSRVVFVSASEQAYVVTENNERFEVGSELSTGLKFAGATERQIILDDNGDFITIGLPEPSNQ